MAKPPVAKYCKHTHHSTISDQINICYGGAGGVCGTHRDAGPHGREHGEGAAVANAGVRDGGEQAGGCGEDLRHLQGGRRHSGL